MQDHRWLKISILVLLCAIFAGHLADGLRVRANANRPPSRNTGAPGEQTCTGCHDTSALNSGGGALTLTGLPAGGYAPSQSIPLSVTMQQAGRSRFGFQVTAIDDTGKQAGTIVVADAARTTLSTGTVQNNTRQYLGQTNAGSSATSAGQGSWNFTWTAPAQSVGRVTFYVAGLAGNNDGDTPGDLVYAINRALMPAAQQCTYAIAPTSANVAAAASTGTVNVTAGTGCAWTAASNVPWITVASGASGSGNGAVAYSVAANTGAARTGTMTVAGQTFTVNQAAQAGQPGTPTPCDDDDFEFKGTIQSLPGTSGFIGDWMVSGRTVRVGMSTKIEREGGQIAVGARVEVEGCLQTDGSILASEIEVKSGGGASYSFTGSIEDLPDTMGRLGDWKISGIVVHVTAATMIKQERMMAAIGVRVEVDGARRADGSVDAYRIEVKSDMAAGQTEFRGTIESLPSTAGRIGQWSISGRRVNVTNNTRLKPDNAPIAVGAIVQVKGAMRQDGAIDASEIELKSNGGGSGSLVEFYGTIETLPGTTGQLGAWTVSGRKVNVVAATKISPTSAQIAVGAVVEVRGTPQADAAGLTINASRIKIKSRSGATEFLGRVESLPAANSLIGDWRVAGRTVHVTAATQIERKYGMLAVGAVVEVEGSQQADGSINATEIEVKQSEAGGAYWNFNPVVTTSAASYQDDNAPEAIVTAWGSNLASASTAATALPLPTTLGNVSVLVDGRLARLFWVSAGQINFHLPPDTPAGTANVVVMNNGQMVSQGSLTVSGVAPSLFTANASGEGVPAGLVLRIRANGQQVYEPLARFDAAQNRFVPAPIVRRAGEQLFLILFGTGLKQAPNADGNAANGVAESVSVTIGGVNAPVIFAGPAPGFAGLEQINVRIPDNAPTTPAAAVLVKVRDVLNNQKQSNAVTIGLQ